jgi:hypothetical protein
VNTEVLLEHGTAAAYYLSRNIRLFQYTETAVEKLILVVKEMMEADEETRVKIRSEAAKTDSKIGHVLQGEDSLRALMNLMRLGGHFTGSKVFTVAWQKAHMQDVHGGVSVLNADGSFFDSA